MCKHITGLIGDKPGIKKRPEKGTVAWVHPKGRFYMVEFQFASGVIRECYGMDE